ncbi:hypothetical protein I4U23_005932 [Adineta vaga]|nr:hypothetical protein I4U23_005932 [Adineta vaga]
MLSTLSIIMTQAAETDFTMYTFRFGTTNKTIQINQEQLKHFPYLTALVERSDDFISMKNHKGEYALDSSIRYRWFMIIYHSIIKQQPSLLFTQLPEKSNILGVLQLYDYLCIKPIPLPRFKHDNLVRINRVDFDENEKYVKYKEATIGARDMAVQLMIALTKDEYDLDDLETRNGIFSLIMNIFSNQKVFNIRFRYHTLTIVKNYCCSSFSQEQQRQLPTVQEICQIRIEDHFVDVNGDAHERLPDGFQNAFSCKSIYITKEEYDADVESKCTTDRYLIAPLFDWEGFQEMSWLNLRNVSYFSPRIHLGSWISFTRGRQQNHNPRAKAKSARSGRFNTLPKRPQIDKFKHRSGPKAQKHR